MRVQRLLPSVFLVLFVAACGDTFTATGGGNGGGGSGATGGSSISAGGSGGSGAAGPGGAGGTGASAGSSAGGSGASGGTGVGGGPAGGSGVGGSGATGGSGVGGSTPVSCQWSGDVNPCGPGNYCAAPGCGDGVCKPVPEGEDASRAPVCGCNGVTYWNGTVAAHQGVSVKSNAECNALEAANCGGIASIECPEGAVCSYQTIKLECLGPDLGGRCWGMPKSCVPGPASGSPAHKCNGDCGHECDMIKAEGPWYKDPDCPL